MSAAQRPAESADGRLVTELARLLARVGIREAFGICGREIVPMWSALVESLQTELPIATRHARHENGAGFAATGSWMVSDRPVALFVTTGPGITNVLTSLETARATGAKLVLLSPLTPPEECGRLGIQETGMTGYFNEALHVPGRLFDLVTVLESDEQLPALAGHLAAGLAGPEGFMAHIAIPTTRQTAAATALSGVPRIVRPAPAPAPAVVDRVAELLAAEPFAVWAGWGARHHAEAIRELLEVTGAPVISSPRGLGVADRHPHFLGVTGNGGDLSVPADLARWGTRRMLVLGTGLGEATSCWDADLIPPAGLIHVDLDPTVFGRAFPEADTLGVQADVGELLVALLARRERLVRREPVHPVTTRRTRERAPSPEGIVHPVAVMDAIQRIVIDHTDIPVLADASSAMFWGAHHLRFDAPGRWLLEGRWGSMGFAGGAVVGAASARGGVALAICGDASMHMVDEISTAVRYGIPAVWLVLNDGGMNIVRHGMEANGRLDHDADFPAADFAAVARAKGADAIRVTTEAELCAALAAAVDREGPLVIDVSLDRTPRPPIETRTKR